MIFRMLISPIPSTEINCGIKNYFFRGLPVWWQKLRRRVEFNASNQQMIFKNRGGVSSDQNIWNRYDFYFDILINQ
ncbi:hypothetical protein KW512_02115 [Mesomycoplasma ovipneumoniae]|uniref:hypothetical protein n=1 Tax=Mesomycoplasma ovipneumoniae TaxID=29562 RepID=UPI0021622375|nr:hypothetical protein [Mesomycoplasma ovipneumoniae]UVO14976.1 hypothetical protein KW512_02115 [Mesomycoplasma ovipneumoniae]